MKKELFAALILICLIVLSIWNLWYVEKMTTELSETISASYTLALEGKWEMAEKLAETGTAQWNNSDNYTHIFIRHTDIDTTTDAFGDYLSCIYSRDTGMLSGAYQKLLAHIMTIYEMEQINLKSIF